MRLCEPKRMSARRKVGGAEKAWHWEGRRHVQRNLKREKESSQ